MLWTLSWRFDPAGARLADRHYSRGKIGSPQFVAPGKCVVLITERSDALWVTRSAQYVRHDWPGAWMNTLFRNEAPDRYLSSDLIRDAIAVTRAQFGEPPDNGMITFIDEDKVRAKRNPGYCYLCAGFRVVGRTKDSDLLVLQCLPADMPAAAEPFAAQRALAI